MNKVIGSVVLTDYNNNTYTIANVDWNKNPESTFERKGNQISFIDYYLEKGIRINDRQQPLLESKNRSRDVKAGKQETVLLIPELCRSTGKIFSILRIF